MGAEQVIPGEPQAASIGYTELEARAKFSYPQAKELLRKLDEWLDIRICISKLFQ